MTDFDNQLKVKKRLRLLEIVVTDFAMKEAKRLKLDGHEVGKQLDYLFNKYLATFRDETSFPEINVEDLTKELKMYLYNPR